MSDQKVYVGDTGTAIELDTLASLAGATVAIRALRPDGTEVEWPGTAVGTAVRFFTLAGSLNQPGTWKLQAKVTNSSGAWLGAMVRLRVYAPFG